MPCDEKDVATIFFSKFHFFIRKKPSDEALVKRIVRNCAGKENKAKEVSSCAFFPSLFTHGAVPTNLYDHILCFHVWLNERTMKNWMCGVFPFSKWLHNNNKNSILLAPFFHALSFKPQGFCLLFFVGLEASGPSLDRKKYLWKKKKKPLLSWMTWKYL